MAYSDVRAALRVWVETVTAQTTIFQQQESSLAPRPELPYCAIFVPESTPASQIPYEETTDIEVGSLTTKKRSWMVNGVLRVDCFGRGLVKSVDLVQELQISIRRRNIREIFRLAGVTVRWLGSLEDIPQPRNTNWEDRSQADFRFRFIQAEDELVPWIETVVYDISC